MALLAAILFQAGGVGCGGTELPVDRALLYLARHQHEDGSWGRPPEHCECLMMHPLEIRGPEPNTQTRLQFADYCRQLRSDQADERERAEKGITQLGLPALRLLQEAWDFPDLETRWRCRSALSNLWTTRGLWKQFRAVEFPRSVDLELRATSLALLSFTGTGYSIFSRDRRPDPFDGTRSFEFGAVVKKALRWLLERQLQDGSFGAVQPESNLIAALVLSEQYGITGRTSLRVPATLAVEYALRLAPRDARSRLWQEFVRQSAILSELSVPPGDPGPILRRLDSDPSPFSAAGTVILSSFYKRPCGEALLGVLRRLEGRLTAEERFWNSLAMCRMYPLRSDERRKWIEKHPYSTWRGRQITEIQCDRGTWPDDCRTFESQLMATMFNAMTDHQHYGYSNSLFMINK
jgi:hypothetical protein